MITANFNTSKTWTERSSGTGRDDRAREVRRYLQEFSRTQGKPRGRAPITVGIDLDSTLAKIDEPWLNRLNKVCGTNYVPSDWKDWNLGFLKDEEKKVFFEVFTPELYDTVKPYEGASEAIRSAVEETDLKLLCVTTNPSKDAEAFASAKIQWLKRHFPELANSVIFSKTKSGLGLDVLIDDAPHHFQEVDYVPVLVERPWNLFVDTPLRFENWTEGKKLLLAFGSHSCSSPDQVEA